MSLTIEQIEEQIANLQKNLNELKSVKLEVTRNFTGQCFAPYQGIEYRRMESDGIAIWENYITPERRWIMVSSSDAKKLEQLYLNSCIVENTLEE